MGEKDMNTGGAAWHFFFLRFLHHSFLTLIYNFWHVFFLGAFFINDLYFVSLSHLHFSLCVFVLLWAASPACRVGKDV